MRLRNGFPSPDCTKSSPDHWPKLRRPAQALQGPGPGPGAQAGPEPRAGARARGPGPVIAQGPGPGSKTILQALALRFKKRKRFARPLSRQPGNVRSPPSPLWPGHVRSPTRAERDDVVIF